MTGVTALAQELIRFDTVNPPGSEEAAIRHLGVYLEGHGIAVELQRLAPDRLNLVARIGGSQAGHLVLCGHVDVVHPGTAKWDSGPFEAQLAGGRLVGRGAADMKGGVAAMAVAMAELAGGDFNPAAGLILAVTAGEEVDMAGARLMASGNLLAGTSHLVVGEPTGLEVFRAEKGILWLKVTAHGRTAHGSMPHLGINAVSSMARFIARLTTDPFHVEPNALLGGPTVSVNTIQGGVKTNIVPDLCSAEIDIRIIPGQSQSDVIGQIQAMLDEVSGEVPARAEVSILQYVPPVETPANDPLVEAAVGAAAAVLGEEPSVGGVSYGTDGAILAPALGCSMVIFGPGKPEQAHQPNEYVEVRELERAVEAYKDIARRMMT